VHRAGLPERTLGHGIHQLLQSPTANLFFASEPRCLVFFREIHQRERVIGSEGQDLAALILACRAQEIGRNEAAVCVVTLMVLYPPRLNRAMLRSTAKALSSVPKKFP